MKYEKWMDQVPNDIKQDAVWSLKVYRAALFASDLCWFDIKPILNKRLYSLSDQIYRSVGSISANVTEGYSRHSLKEQARYYEIALGSARESKDWYFKSRHILGEKITYHRIRLLTSVSKLLLTMIKDRRDTYEVQEEEVSYKPATLDELLLNVPVFDV